MGTLHVGVLGAAQILHDALIAPASMLPGVTVSAIASRDRERASAAALRHRIPKVRRSYEELLEDPAIDAVYIPLPAALHAEWTVAAIAAGKHVLCEKPFTSNSADAEQVADRARESQLTVMEAYHSHYHPLYGRLRQIVRSGEIGVPLHAHAEFCVPIPPGKNIRWNPALGGGGLLDVGYYPVRALSELFGEPIAVTSGRARMRGEVDRRVDAELSYASGVRGTIVSSIWSARLLSMALRVRGTDGTMRVSFPFHPHLGARIRIDGRHGKRTERTDRRSTYSYQLSAFRDAVGHGHPVGTGPDAAAANIRHLESIYRAAGIATRP